MTKRMWAAADGKLEIEGKRGSFDIAYGNASELQKLDIWLPDTKQEKVPFIFIIHGGGFMALDKRDCEMAHAIKETIKRGFAAVSLNYRMTQEVKFPEPVRDIKQAIRFIKKHGAKYQLDTEKMMVWGGSAGGYLTLMAALFNNESYFDNPDDENVAVQFKIDGAIAWYPITEFATLDHQLQTNSLINKYLRKEIKDQHECYVNAMPESEENAFPYHASLDSAGSILLGENCCVDNELTRKASPIYYIKTDMPRIYIQHGSGDEIVPMQQSINFALKANELCGEERVICEIVPDAIHGSMLFETADNYDKLFAFIHAVMD